MIHELCGKEHKAEWGPLVCRLVRRYYSAPQAPQDDAAAAQAELERNLYKEKRRLAMEARRARRAARKAARVAKEQDPDVAA